MCVSVSRLPVETASSDGLVAAFRRRARLVQSHEDFVDLQVCRSDRERHADKLDRLERLHTYELVAE